SSSTLPLHSALPISEPRRLPSARLCSFYCLQRDSPCFRGIAPLADADPLLAFQILVVGEEVLDLLEHDRRQVLPLADIRIIRERSEEHTSELQSREK